MVNLDALAFDKNVENKNSGCTFGEFDIASKSDFKISHQLFGLLSGQNCLRTKAPQERSHVHEGCQNFTLVLDVLNLVVRSLKIGRF